MTVYVNALSPQAVSMTITAPAGIDLTTATSVSLTVKKPSGAQVTWTTSIVSAATATMTVSHPFDAGDVDQAGQYVVVPTVTFPSGPRFGSRALFRVEDHFA